MGVPLWLSVIGTALGLGIVHVMTGPDHLSALSTLSVGKPLRTAFGLGVRWGTGHSFGLLIVAIIFFAVGQSVNLDTLSYYADIFVGIFMIVLGSWYMLKAFRERQRYLRAKEDKERKELLRKQSAQVEDDIDENIQNNGDAYDMNMIDVNAIDKEQIELQEIDDDIENNKDIDNKSDDDKIDNADNAYKGISEQEHVSADAKPNKEQSSSEYSSDDRSDDNRDCFDHPFVFNTINSEHHHLKSYQNNVNDVIPDDDIIIDANASLNPLFDPNDKDDGRRTKCITRVAAFVAGIFHGVAGPGGVLGVMVALKLNDWFLSSLYLILFFISSIVTMGIYAVTYGYCTQRMTVCANNKQKCAFVLKLVSAVFSFIVGIIWITLTFNGTLEQWFD